MKAARDRGMTSLFWIGGDESSWIREILCLDSVGSDKTIESKRYFIHELMSGYSKFKLSQSEMILFYIYFNLNQIRALWLHQRAKRFMKRDFMKCYNISDRFNT